MKPATASFNKFGILHGFICTANEDESIPLNSFAVAKIEPQSQFAAFEMKHRANSYPRLVEALRVAAADLRRHEARESAEEAEALLRDLGEQA